MLAAGSVVLKTFPEIETLPSTRFDELVVVNFAKPETDAPFRLNGR